MSEKMDVVTGDNSIENARLDAEDEILYHQTDEEYDEIFASAQMSVVDEFDIQTKTRLTGPSGSGKTTLGRSLAIDVKIADVLINEYGLELWNKTLDELAVFHHIVMNSDSENTNENEDGVCPNCEGKSFYERKTKTPTYSCSCGTEFDELKTVASESANLDYYEQFEDIDDIQSELENRGLISDSGDKTDDYPHSQASAYRDIYKVYTGGADYPSAPYFEVGMSHAKYAKDLIGHPHIGDEGTTFITGKVTEAVKASQDEVTVITLDEINRAPTSAKDELYSALDGRVKVSMDEAGGLEIKGDASNLIVVSTMNKGSGHHVEPLDFAEKRRLGDTYPVDFLGVEHPEKEIELIESNTPVSNDLASEIVRTANEIRATAKSEGSNLSYGAPTGVLMVWAKKAFTNHLAGKSEPVVRAGRSSLANTIYDHNDDEVSEVRTIISKNMQGVDFFPDENDNEDNNSSSSSAISEKRYVCEDEQDVGCSWSAVESKADYVATEYLSCPECNGGVSEIKPGE